MKAVYISWYDAVSQDEWTDLSEVRELECHVIKTLGWLVHEDERKLIIACSWDEEREGSASSWVIPKTWLLEMKEIQLPK